MIPRKLLRVCAVLCALLAAWFFVYPPIRAVIDLQDPALRQPGIPRAAWRLARNLTPRYAKWAKERVAHGRPETLSTSDISGTEWPLFGSVFYLWAMENLQTAWDAGDQSVGLEPKVFGRDAIIAAADLIIDPRHAAWVKKRWGDDYLHRENVFYRMLVMAALATRATLLKDNAHLDLLRDQVETFSRELDESKCGLLNDYPGECYPGDVLAALMCIKRADVVLGTDHSAMIRRAVRGFTGTHATRHQLPPYAANASSGMPLSDARGCANSYQCLTAPELWPVQARQWFELYDRFFWQERFTAVGYREFPRGSTKSDWNFDVDAGPVIAGHGVSASAFGVGAARKNGRFDRAYPLAAEMLVTSVELPQGTLAVPRLLSNLSDAPMLGEAAILWLLTVQPEKGVSVTTGGELPTYVIIVAASLFLFGVWRISAAITIWREAGRTEGPPILAPRSQPFIWAACLAVAMDALLTGFTLLGTAALIGAMILPLRKRGGKPTGTEGWEEAQVAESSGQVRSPLNRPADGSTPS